jgi:hypothetical protein
MNHGPCAAPPRLLDLLADRALFGLSAAEGAELETLLAACPESDAECFDRATAALALALEPPPREPLPPVLFQRIAATARRYLVENACDSNDP